MLALDVVTVFFFITSEIAFKEVKNFCASGIARITFERLKYITDYSPLPLKQNKNRFKWPNTPPPINKSKL